jgi:hypothetical protein
MDSFEEITVCELCGSRAARIDRTAPMTIRFKCDVCGEFGATVEAVRAIRQNGEIRPYVSAATRQASARGKPITLEIDNYLALAEEHRWTSVQAKARKILEYLRDKSSFFAQQVPLSHEIDYPLFDAVAPEECWQLMRTLKASDHIVHVVVGDRQHWSLTMPGWEVLEPLQAGGIPGRCFVAMAFDVDLDRAYFEGIKPAIEEAGYDPICMKEHLTNDNICDVIVAEIRKAQFVIADFTKQKGGVYFEAGFAKALRKEVFWTCREDDFSRLHFDTNHYGHLKWSTPEDLKRQLLNRITAELGLGPFNSRK